MKKEPKYIYTRDSLHSEIDFLPSRHLVKHTRLPSHRALTNRNKIVQYLLGFLEFALKSFSFFEEKTLNRGELLELILSFEENNMAAASQNFTFCHISARRASLQASAE